LEETNKIIDLYADFAEEHMALPVIKGRKTENERFPGALDTFAIEALMQDGKALQSGTSHFLGQNFAKAFDVQFTSKEGSLEYVWATSWGVSTRLMGALIMAHSDDNGLVLPPKLAPLQVVIVPIYKNQEEFSRINNVATGIKSDLEGAGLSVKYDDRDTHKPGWKFSEYELKGVPVRIAIGPRDLDNNTVEVARRDTLEKQTVSRDLVNDMVIGLMDEIQQSIYRKSLELRRDNTYKIDDWDEFREIMDKKPGFVLAHWDGTTETELKIKEETKASIRCIPFDAEVEEGKCIYTGKPSDKRVLFAKAY
jgi:prolyl-tRNA synthetase